MRVPRALAPLLLSFLALFALPSVGESPGSVPLLDAIYLGQGRVLTAAPPRQLSLNAHTTSFLYQPGGLEIAYSGTQTSEDGNQQTAFVRLVGLRRGETMTLLNKTTDFAQQAAALGMDPDKLRGLDRNLGSGGPASTYELLGWSGDGRYLVTHHEEFVPAANRPGDPDAVDRYTCVEVAANPPLVRHLTLPTAAASGDALLYGNAQWSPGHTRIFFSATTMKGSKPEERSSMLVVYDPGRDRLQTVPFPGERFGWAWADDDHVLMRVLQSGKGAATVSRDLNTGQEAQVAHAQPPDFGHPSPICPTAPNFILDSQYHRIVDNARVSKIESHALWVRRVNGPKPLSALPVGLTPGEADPQAVWSPKGNQVAFVSHGDLFVTDLTPRAATPREKVAAGEKLPCPEERQLAMDNAREIGMAVMMYTQDYDEQFPSAQSVNDKLSPYVKDSDVFAFGDVKFQYKAPSDLGMVHMAEPAQTEIGTYDIPCGHVVMYADGHVKFFAKDGGG